MNVNYVSRAVYCDFDGTITSTETFVGIMKKFAPALTEKILPQLYAKELTLQEGVRLVLESIPARYYPEIINYTNKISLREGLGELIDFLDGKNIPFHVISGGLQETIVQKLSQDKIGETTIRDRVASITAIELDASGENLQVPPQKFESETELVAKVKVMEFYLARERVVIGDSLTDINMAVAADLVFARDRLISYLEAENKPFIPWENFFEIRDRLQERWG
ncbi:MAG: HAD-IB family phosphatase [Cyanobacteria bacterium P01_E01_bin.42]